jgi:hypothetical protein
VRTSRTEELNTAARIVATDVRSLQSRALSVQNIRTCLNGGGASIVCEASVVGCVSACADAPPAAVGVRFMTSTSSYDFFAEVGPTAPDWLWSATGRVLTRSLITSGIRNVTISAIDRGSPSSVAFERQNGSPVFNGCRISQGCVSTPSITITLRHAQSNATKTVTVNASGRVSIQ